MTELKKYGNFNLDLNLGQEYDTSVFFTRSASINHPNIDPMYGMVGILEYNFAKYKWQLHRDLPEYNFYIRFAFQI